jgi:hypothetical protein
MNTDPTSVQTTTRHARPWQATTAAVVLLAWVFLLFILTAMFVPAVAKASVTARDSTVLVAAPPILCFMLSVLLLIASVGILGLRRWASVFTCIVIVLLLLTIVWYGKYLYSDSLKELEYIERTLELVIAPSGVKNMIPMLAPLFACFTLGPLILLFTRPVRSAMRSR